jgi:regulation of enolase protein 1 (concanavalin A-like superfamily)
VELSSLPFSPRWLGAPLTWSADGDTLTIAAGPRTDWFVHPGTREAKLDAPAFVGPTAGDFLLSARVEVDFASRFDAGVLALWRDEQTWAKLCLEYSPDGEAMVVSVVTRSTSDDCNSSIVAGNSVWLRIARIGREFAFHTSTDRTAWRLVRHFALTDDDEIEVGFLAQSPTGEGCTARFSEIRFSATTLADLRSGE